MVAADKWDRPYPRELAAYPVRWVKEAKHWPTVGRVDNVYGDRNLACAWCATVLISILVSYLTAHTHSPPVSAYS